MATIQVAAATLKAQYKADFGLLYSSRLVDIKADTWAGAPAILALATLRWPITDVATQFPEAVLGVGYIDVDGVTHRVVLIQRSVAVSDSAPPA